ncbi:MAG: protease modulator HflC [Myxococcota bacterium]|nr:protease modulator HflC [Myxococcota bacterium]
MKFIMTLLFLLGVGAGTIWIGQFGWGPVVIVNEWEDKIPLLLGSPWREPIVTPGPTWRIPLIEEMVTLDKRLQFLDADPVEMQIESERLEVDYYAVWRMADPLLFRRSFPGGSDAAALIIKRRLKSLVGATVGRMTLQELLARSELIDDLGESLRKDMAAKGVDIVDVRINRTELPKKALSAAYDQMREQRRAISREYRAKGEREAREIRAKADREARTVLAEAESRSQLTRGEGDAQAAAIYAKAYMQDEDFYIFTRSLAAYRATLKQRTTLVLSPQETFFRFLAPASESEGGEGDKGPAAPAVAPESPAATD